MSTAKAGFVDLVHFFLNFFFYLFIFYSWPIASFPACFFGILEEWHSGGSPWHGNSHFASGCCFRLLFAISKLWLRFHGSTWKVGFDWEEMAAGRPTQKEPFFPSSSRFQLVLFVNQDSGSPRNWLGRRDRFRSPQILARVQQWGTEWSLFPEASQNAPDELLFCPWLVKTSMHFSKPFDTCG